MTEVAFHSIQNKAVHLTQRKTEFQNADSDLHNGMTAGEAESTTT